jgi:hypothetical protein
VKYPLLKPKLFRIEMLSHDSALRPANEVLQAITEVLFANSIKNGREVRCYIRVEYANEQKEPK